MKHLHRSVGAVESRENDPPSFTFSPSTLPDAMRALDIAMILLAAATATLLIGDSNLMTHKVTCAVFVCVCHLFLGARAGLFTIAAIMRPLKRADDVFLSLMTAMMLFLSVIFALDASINFSIHWLIAFTALVVVLAVSGRLVAFVALRDFARRGMIGQSMAVLGVGEQSRRFLRRFDRSRPYFTRVAGVFHGHINVDEQPPPESFEGHPVIGGIEALFDAVRAGSIDAVVVAMPWSADGHVIGTVERLKELPIDVYLGTDLVGFELNFRPVLGDFAALPVFEVVQRPISGWSWAIKTLMDRVLAGALLLLLSPLLLAIAVAIRIDTPGPVLFRQARLGFNNRIFHIYKFRSMHHGPTPETQVRQARRGDPRVTRVGRLIRATSLDELPQVLNVLEGTMSLVGPRPHAVSHNEEYGRQIRGYFARHKVKPGITGWAQVNGLRGETEALDKMEARIQHDVYYVENWSILFDLRILLKTAVVVLFQKSAY